MRDLGLDYEKIPACRNGCMLFWKDNEKLERCTKCKASKWKQTVRLDNDSSQKSKRKPANVLRWFPLIPRLQRLFMSTKTASHMKWHYDQRTKDGVLRHPADGKSWKTFDERYPEFALDPRNVRLGLASDGFNHFGNMSNSYSTWPVMLVPYNLPPWMSMKQASIMLSLIIQGPSAPGMKIDVYLESLISELKELWDVGVPTYDAATKGYFTMCAALMWIINDFLAYGDLSGWSTKERAACPCCMRNTWAKRLRNGRKFAYMGHMRWLPMNHRFRKDKKLFDGTQELDPPPIVLNGEEIMSQLGGVGFVVDQPCVGQKRGSRRASTVEPVKWKKRSIFFTLPYWKYNLLRHNLDVMHIEKNVLDNIIGTLLGMKGKTKDNYEARLDLEEMGLRGELHPVRTNHNKTILPASCFTMSNKEKYDFLAILANVKVPDGYASNVSRCVKLKERCIRGLKSHDSHIIMQQLMPIALRGMLPRKVIKPLIELSSLFREICSKTLRLKDLDRLEGRIPFILCDMERIFPPGFFTVMVHVVIHLVRECKLGGPVHYRWMYPIERCGTIHSI
jgi:hypothetical protein